MARRRNTEEEVCLVKVAQTGNEVREFSLNGDRTVAGALELAEIDYDDNSRIRVNGRPAELDQELVNGDIVTIAGEIKGGTR